MSASLPPRKKEKMVGEEDPVIIIFGTSIPPTLLVAHTRTSPLKCPPTDLSHSPPCMQVKRWTISFDRRNRLHPTDPSRPRICIVITQVPLVPSAGGFGSRMVVSWAGWGAERADGRCAFPLVLLSCPQKNAIQRVVRKLVWRGCEGKLSRSG